MLFALKALPFWSRSASLKPGREQSPPTVPDRRPWRGQFDVLGRPITIVENSDGTESALDFSTRQRLEVPVDWVRAFGREIDDPEFHGLMLGRRTRIKWPEAGPVAFVGADGSAMIVTPEGATLTRVAGATPRWRRGLHRTPEELRTMRRAVGELARNVIADFQDSTGGAAGRVEVTPVPANLRSIQPEPRPPLPSRQAIYGASNKRISPMLARFSYRSTIHALANLTSLAYNDGIPVLVDDDPVYWDDVGAEAADALAIAAIARTARR
jgi:hypothetical protein